MFFRTCRHHSAKWGGGIQYRLLPLSASGATAPSAPTRLRRLCNIEHCAVSDRQKEIYTNSLLVKSTNRSRRRHNYYITTAGPLVTVSNYYEHRKHSRITR